MFRTGKDRLIGIAWLGIASSVSVLCVASSARADDQAQFTAQVDHRQIGLDDTVSLKLNVQASGSSSVGQPTFDAPGFEVVNSYDSTYVESYYDQSTNQFGMKNTQQSTKVLRPLRQGDLRISHIRVTIDGRTRSAPDIIVTVGPPGAPTPPPTQYGGGGGGVGPRGTGRYNNHAQIFVRAEVDRDKVYKGQQVVVSYYLYRRVRAMNLQVSQFPTLNGFLREELEMPVMQPRLDSEPVVIDGVPYQRSLLARYAAYPLQEGKLKVDPLGLKYSYFGESGLSDDGEDPFLNFFKQLAPREGASQSDPIYVQVMPLPTQGRPANFSGGVGDFSITSAVDKYDVRANEPVTLTVKIEGQGNVAAIGEPKVSWPGPIEYYDSKGTVHSGKGGVGSKIFDILLIPRRPGSVTLPPMELSYFDPAQKKYITKATDPIRLNVAEAAPGAQAATNPTQPVPTSEATPPGEAPAPELRELKPLVQAGPSWTDRFPIWRILYYLVAGALAVLLVLIGKALATGAGSRRGEQDAESGKAIAPRLAQLRARASSPGIGWSEVAAIYEALHTLILDALDRTYGIGAHSLPREELGRILVGERGMSQGRWERIRELLEYAEMVRYSGASNGTAQAHASERLGQWIDAAEAGMELRK